MNRIQQILFSLTLFVNVAKGQSDSAKNHETYLGVNVFRIVAGDYEIQYMQQINRVTVSFMAGYDLNYFEHWFTAQLKIDSIQRATSIEEKSSPSARYWYGKGPVFRFCFDYNFFTTKHPMRFLSLEALYKGRDYTNHFFGDSLINFLESGKQTIFGLTVYYGTKYRMGKRFSIKTNYGIGFRMLHSVITRPEYFYDYRIWPQSSFTKNLTLPSFNLGVTIMTRI